jgi:peptidyl-prolyl cis-trans isomerase A (cyclophilin A)
MKRMIVAVLGLAWLTLGCDSQEPAPQSAHPETLMDPQSPAMQEQAPDEFNVLFQTTAGDFTVAVERDLAPLGADRFYNLVRHGYYDEQRFFRVLPGFIVQWGMHGDPQIGSVWSESSIQDDPVMESNTKGTITYAKKGIPNSRSTQLFINLGSNGGLDGQGFAPFGKVTDGMESVEAINSEYGQSPDQRHIGTRGNEYLASAFPNLDYIKTARVVD